MLELDVGVPGTDPMWHMYHWRGSVDTRGTARPGPVGRRVYIGPAPGRPVRLWGLAERPECPHERQPSGVVRGGAVTGVAVVWLWIRVTVRFRNEMK